MKPIDRVHRWWFQRKVAKRLKELTAKVDKMHGQLTEFQDHLKVQRQNLLRANRTLGKELERVQKDFQEVVAGVDEVQLFQTSYHTETDKLREELGVLRDVVIPQLTAANDLLLERWNRAAAEEIRLQAPVPREVL